MNAPTSKEAQAFIRDLLAVCEKHKLSLAHEDEHGSFIVTEPDTVYAEWLAEATDDTPEGKRLRDEFYKRFTG